MFPLSSRASRNYTFTRDIHLLSSLLTIRSQGRSTFRGYGSEAEAANDGSCLDINVVNYFHGISYLEASIPSCNAQPWPPVFFASAIFRRPFTIKYAGETEFIHHADVRHSSR